MKNSIQTKEMKEFRKAMWKVIINALELIGIIAVLIAIVK